MNSFRLALTIFRRMAFYATFVILGIAFLAYVVLEIGTYSRQLHRERETLLQIDADVIAPKGSSVDHLRRILKLESLAEPPLIPSQLYTTLTTDTPAGLKLVPVLYWGVYKDTPVIAADPGLQEILGREFTQLSQLGDREVIVGRDLAARQRLNAGDTIEIQSKFGSASTNVFSDRFKIQAIADLGAWNGAVLSSLAHAGSILDKVDFVPEQIWKKLILSYVFVTGPEHWRAETKQLIDKRTVAVDLRLSDEVPGLLKLSGINEKLEFEVLTFALVAAFVALGAFLAIWIPILRRMSGHLHRSGFPAGRMVASFVLLFVGLTFAGLVLADLSHQFFPIF